MPTTTADPLETATAESADALASMETEAAEFFAARDATRSTEALNPVAPALEKAAAAPVKAAPAKVAPVTPAKPAAKVPGPLIQAPAKPAEAAPAAKPTADPATDFSDVPRDYAPGKTRAPQWDKLHAKADHFESIATAREQELATLRAELEAARSTSTNTPSAELAARLAALQTERDAFRSQLQAVAGERIFDADNKPRRDAAIAAAKAAVGATDAARIETLLNLSESSYRDEQLEAVLATLPPLRATKLATAVAELDRFGLERESAAAKGGEVWQRRIAEEASQRERAARERIARATSTFDAEVKEWEAVGLSADEITAARSVYSGQGATLQDASRAALWAVAGPRAAQLAQSAQARVTELEGELAKLRGAQPGVGAAAAGALPTEADGEDDPATTSYADRIARQAMRAGVRFGS